MISHRPNPSKHIIPLVAAIFVYMAAYYSALATDKKPGLDTTLRVYMKSGYRETFLLTSKPAITFTAKKCHIVSDDFSAEYYLSDIDYADFAVNIYDDEENSIIIDLSDPEAVSLHQLDVNTEVRLYSIDGIARRMAHADESGSAMISLTGLPRGGYIVSVSDMTFKIYRKK